MAGDVCAVTALIVLRQGTLDHAVCSECVEDDEDEPEGEQEAGREILADGGAAQLCTAKHGELPPQDQQEQTQEGRDGVEEYLDRDVIKHQNSIRPP